MRLSFIALAAVLPYALAFGGTAHKAKTANMSMSAAPAESEEPTLGASPDLKSATPSGCGKYLNCWDCENTGSCNWYSNGCSTATSAGNPGKCNSANPNTVTACDQKYDCTNCVYQQGCIWFNNQCKYSESGNCQNDPTCANTTSQCPVSNPCSSISDCGGCALTNGCSWSTYYGKCQNNCSAGCVYDTNQCPYSYCDNYTNSGCETCTGQSGCIFKDNRCIQSSKPCTSGNCFNTPGQCPRNTGCAAVYDCAGCTRTNNSAGNGKCQWQNGQCKDYCDGFSTCTTQDYQC